MYRTITIVLAMQRRVRGARCTVPSAGRRGAAAFAESPRRWPLSIVIRATIHARISQLPRLHFQKHRALLTCNL